MSNICTAEYAKKQYKAKALKALEKAKEVEKMRNEQKKQKQS